jgi:hypothetical protein
VRAIDGGWRLGAIIASALQRLGVQAASRVRSRGAVAAGVARGAGSARGLDGAAVYPRRRFSGRVVRRGIMAVEMCLWFHAVPAPRVTTRQLPCQADASRAPALR